MSADEDIEFVRTGARGGLAPGVRPRRRAYNLLIINKLGVGFATGWGLVCLLLYNGTGDQSD
jgi:hypothetical protein